MVTTATDATAAIAVNRFGLGKRASEPLPADPRHWLLDQIGRYEPRPATFAQLQTTPEIATQYASDRSLIYSSSSSEMLKAVTA